MEAFIGPYPTFLGLLSDTAVYGRGLLSGGSVLDASCQKVSVYLSASNSAVPLSTLLFSPLLGYHVPQFQVSTAPGVDCTEYPWLVAQSRPASRSCVAAHVRALPLYGPYTSKSSR